ncbi:Alpha/Beta hydrolase protein [Apodospora peruviana]|uniref:Kynurenine formamidase n=1 Tax=Apodospora peruviana TaxID=516989 RepID=A0AAE0HZJ5_9PEZI|nr:Alpha/Beta hydrolase protein [Apodospora peruviana]
MSEEEDWASVPWTRLTGGPTDDTTIGWHKQRVPYGGLALQTLDVWIPAASSSTTAPPDAADLLSRPGGGGGQWLIYIHGGAWRDPEVSSSSFSTAASQIFCQIRASGSGSPKIAGLASLNYRLSPYPHHPTDPSPPPSGPPDPARLAKHPDHISDVLTGLAFLQRLGAAADGEYILAGHSCGATLAFQAVMDPARWGLSTRIVKPTVLVGLNGLYHLAGFIAHPPDGYAGLRDAYEEFTRAAFGDDESVWKEACPASATAWPSEWKEGKRVVLVESREDTLVPYNQLEGMREYLKSSSTALQVDEMGATGGHDEIWQKGDQLAEICLQVILNLWQEIP